jgi:hypothetical protein
LFPPGPVECVALNDPFDVSEDELGGPVLTDAAFVFVARRTARTL